MSSFSQLNVPSVSDLAGHFKISFKPSLGDSPSSRIKRKSLMISEKGLTVGVRKSHLVQFKICIDPTSSPGKPQNLSQLGVMPLRLVSRKEWGATPPHWRVPLVESPVSYVVIKYFTHTRICEGDEQCFRLMKAMQVHHRDELGFADIEVNFLVASDGTVYEGRGWFTESTNYHPHGGRSIDINYIGDYRVKDPPPVMVQGARDLIDYGVQNNYIKPDYEKEEIRWWDFSLDVGHTSPLMDFDPAEDTEYFIHNRLKGPVVV